MSGARKCGDKGALKRENEAVSPNASARARRLIDLYGDTCAYCHDALTDETRTVDHWLPASRGGSNALDNLLLACVRCNSLKGSIPGPAFDLMIRLGLLRLLDNADLLRRPVPRSPKRTRPTLRIVPHDEGFALARNAQVEGGGPLYREPQTKEEWKALNRRIAERARSVADSG